MLEKMLRDYGKELHLGVFTNEELLESLIRFHKTYINEVRDMNKCRERKMQEGYKHGYERGLEHAKENCINIDKLKKMTIEEVSELI